ncbi:MAG: hypothetical protein ACLPHE_03260 [Methanobacterium sp.]
MIQIILMNGLKNRFILSWKNMLFVDAENPKTNHFVTVIMRNSTLKVWKLPVENLILVVRRRLMDRN